MHTWGVNLKVWSDPHCLLLQMEMGHHDWMSARWNTTCTECEEEKTSAAARWRTQNRLATRPWIETGSRVERSQQLQRRRIKNTRHRFYFLLIETVKLEYLVVCTVTPAMFICVATSPLTRLLCTSSTLKNASVWWESGQNAKKRVLRDGDAGESNQEVQSMESVSRGRSHFNTRR